MYQNWSQQTNNYKTNNYKIKAKNKKQKTKKQTNEKINDESVCFAFSFCVHICNIAFAKIPSVCDKKWSSYTFATTFSAFF